MDPLTAPTGVGPLINVTTDTTSSGFTVYSILALFNWVTAPFGFVINIFIELEPLLVFLLYAVALGLLAGAIIAIITELVMAFASAVLPERDTTPKAMEESKQKGDLAITTPRSSRSSTSSLSFESDDDPWASTSTAVSFHTKFLVPSITTTTTAGGGGLVRQRNPKPPLRGLLTETIHEESSSNLPSPSPSVSTA
ncbi:hypothetical protein B0T21DRAFT_362177 [Apiosordaria backusii]|uniref:Uncharacterized protein n=1 Tax=Apiosordaria backusii TaxID=314023 RepID=A0AA40EI21_9PEZI|nr:hypothetical protein B0T21DRAFT_362177 [Apiosordaria backusii]